MALVPLPAIAHVGRVLKVYVAGGKMREAQDVFWQKGLELCQIRGMAGKRRSGIDCSIEDEEAL